MPGERAELKRSLRVFSMVVRNAPCRCRR